MAAGSAAVLTAFLTNLYICIACFSIFTILRSRPWAKRFFAARRYAKDIDLRPQRLPSSLFGWVWPVLTYKEEDIIDECGLDCAMYLRILRFGVEQFFVLTIWCIIFILPPNLSSNEINRLLAEQGTVLEGSAAPPPFPSPVNNDAAPSPPPFGNNVNGKEYKFTDFDKYSLSNIEASSQKMWCHLISIYFVVIFTQWHLWRFNKDSVLLRIMYLGNSRRGGPSHTILVTDIPGVSEAVAKGLAQHRKMEKSLKKSMSMRSDGDVQAGLDSAGSELQSMPSMPATEPKLPVSTKSVTIVAPKDVTNPLYGSQSAPVATPTKAKLDTMPSFGTPTHHAGGAAASPFAAASANAATAAADPATPRASAVGGVPLTPRKSGGFLLRKGESAKPKPSYQLVADVDPRYAATGGKIEQPHVGLSNDEILTELEVVEPEDLTKLLPAHLGMDIRPVVSDRRNTKRYHYDLDDERLDPLAQAKKKLEAGVTPQQLVAQEFGEIYQPVNVAAVNMIQDTASLEPLVTEYNKIAEALEDYLDMAKLRLKLRKGLPQKKVTVMGAMYSDWEYVKKFNTKWLIKLDAVDFWLARLKFLRERIITEQKVSMRKIAPSAFVTMNTRMAQSVGANSLMSHSENAWRVKTAPAPFEVVWGNLALTMPIKSGRLYFLWAAFWAMTIFFMVPVTLIQALIEVPKLANIPVLGKIVTAPVVRQLLEAIVPGLVLKIFLAIVPIILRIMARMSGATSLSEIDFGVVKRFFLFQVIVVFFGNIIAGSFFNQLKQWVSNPTSVIPTLGKSIPMTSTFFITYTLVNGLAVKSIFFIRAPQFFIFWILSKFAGSPRARQRMWTYQYTDNGTTVVDHMITMLIGTTFSCINPIMCPVALVYFLVNYIGERYNNIYVLRREYESAGKLWKTVYQQIMVTLYIMQMVMLGLLSIKKFPFAPLIIPLLLFSIGSNLSTLALFRRPWSVVALHDAAEMDVLEADHRRMTLLKESKEERKKRQSKHIQLQRAASKKAEAAGEEAPLKRDLEAAVFKRGKKEKLLLETLQGDSFALTTEEKVAIAQLYRNPAFKVALEDIERLEALAVQVQERLPKLNAWLIEYKKYRRAVKKAKLVGNTDPIQQPTIPEDLTIFDKDPTLQDDEDDE